MGIVFAFRRRKLQIIKWASIVFITFYGSVIYLSEESDGYMHSKKVYDYYLEMTPGQFFGHFGDVLTFTKSEQDLQPDLYIHILSYVVGSVLQMPRLFFVVVAFVYAFFYIGTLFKVIRFVPGFKYDWLFYLFLYLLVVWKGIEGINTVRTYTGLWVLAYGMVSYFQTKKYRYLFYIFCVPFIHFSYYIMAIPAWFVLFAGNRPRFYSLLFFFSFFVSIINPQTAIESLSETEIGEQKTKSYGVEDEVTTEAILADYQQKGTNWYVTLGRAGFHIWAVKVLALFIILRGYYGSRMTEVEAKLFGVGILTMFLSSSAWFIFALSARSSIVAGIFILIPFIMMAQRGAFNHQTGKMVYWERVALVSILLFTVPMMVLRMAEVLSFTSFFVVSLPCIVWMFPDANLPLNEAIKFAIGFKKG